MTTSNVLMIRPVKFTYNFETSLTNAFQRLMDETDENVQEKALIEFDGLVQLLRNNGINVIVAEDSPDPHTPDSIFPNNWISMFEDNSGTICLHPMYAINRRLERKEHVLNAISQQFLISTKLDLTPFEQTEEFLEGTGSMVLDRANRIVYACLSSRTNKNVFDEFCNLMNYTGVSFRALDSHGRAIYHTNVMMSVADKFAIVCMESVRREWDKTRLIESFATSGKELITIDTSQMMRFAGNVLQVQSSVTGEKLLVMSSQAYHSLRAEQIEKISKYSRIIHSSVDIIEVNGGGGVRCMIAEIFLPLKK